MLGSLAEIFLDNLSLEIAKGKRGRARAGLSNSRQAPFGYTRENGLDIINKEEAEAVGTIFEEYCTGEYTDATISEMLDRMGFKPKKSERWSRVTAQDMLQSPFYYGAVRYRDKLYPGRHEPIVTKELWDEAQRVRAEKHGPYTTAQKNFCLLQRVVRCWECKRRLHMYADVKHGGTYYRDPAGLLDHDCVHKGRALGTYTIDREVASTIRRLKLPENWKDRILTEANYQDHRRKVQDRQNALRARLKRLKYLYIEGDINTQQYESQKKEALEEIASLQMPDDSTIIEAGQVLESLASLWDELTPREKQEMIRSMPRAIYIDIEEQRVVCYEPFAEFVPLFDQVKALSEREGCYYREQDEHEDQPPEVRVGDRIEVRQTLGQRVLGTITRLSRSRVDYLKDDSDVPYWTLMRWYGGTWKLASHLDKKRKEDV
ncbi:recombinase family protein [Chloroflexota bacterium]